MHRGRHDGRRGRRKPENVFAQEVNIFLSPSVLRLTAATSRQGDSLIVLRGLNDTKVRQSQDRVVA